MEKKTEFLYMKRYRPDYAIIIMYEWGSYYIARMCDSKDKGIAYTLKRYKTLSGAEKYLRNYSEIGENKDIVPELYFGSEKFIKDGKYWRKKEN